MKGKLVILLVAVLMVSMILLEVSDSKASVGDTGASEANAAVSDIEVASNETQEEDPPESSSATITITWRTGAND